MADMSCFKERNQRDEDAGWVASRAGNQLSVHPFWVADFWEDVEIRPVIEVLGVFCRSIFRNYSESLTENQHQIDYGFASIVQGLCVFKRNTMRQC